MQVYLKHIFNFTYIFILVSSLYSCDNNEESAAEHPSYRDGTYSGKQLTVSLDGQDLTTVSSVTLSSKLLNANVSPDKNSTQVVPPSNPTFTTTVEMDGFPDAGQKSSFTTISDLMGFNGTTTIQGVNYKYNATFTGDPLTTHDNQGLILRFTKQ